MIRRFVCAVALASTLATTAGNTTPLDDYVAAADPAYRWEATEQVSDDECSVHMLRLRSQKWRGRLWSHYLTVAIPKEVTTSTALMLILGDHSGIPHATMNTVIARIAKQTGAVVAKVGQTPNQPRVFPDEWDSRYLRAGRKEDALIAYTWHQFLETGDSSWPLRLPMTKTATAAMDAVQEFCREQGVALPVETFAVSGKSKRGWTAWTAAAVDNRVVAVVPMVIDCLNLRDSFIHQLRSYGEFSPASRDYLDVNLHNRWLEPRFEELMAIVEPYHYRDRLTMPKYVINSTGDPFFVPDSSQHYFEDLPGQKHLRYIPNSDHALRNTDYQESLAAYFYAIVHQQPLPELDWSMQDDTLSLACSEQPEQVTLWTAYNPDARDFRYYQVGSIWKPTPLTAGADGTYRVATQLPDRGYRAYLLEAKFSGGLTFTTDVFIVPDELPFMSIESTGHAENQHVKGASY